MKKIISAVFLTLVIFVFGCSPIGKVTDLSDLEASGSLNGGIREVNVRAFQFNFDPNPIIVNQGEKVRLIVTSTDVAHGIAIPKYRINARIFPGRPTNVEFVADKAGTFPFVCSVSCGAGHSSMRGKLIVR